ncbi:uncharacterized protein BO80DRAFT_427282 [Aspergillus ibericus CBS 121593]|uniref:Uncharacterized protein n=1 Tax=Aspergillus ibericus CBS 121593 TaxID=1448316 RepID=A0A395GSX8_9EURO|nr:hypothetical protein BO80DRAFT_427282 [Aspergillus ibericus CBS 121593]RAK98690.1 hypothetical protein BO80DRAFT_427282 [Aspergillus ibericus CBS 121593]
MALDHRWRTSPGELAGWYDRMVCASASRPGAIYVSLWATVVLPNRTGAYVQQSHGTTTSATDSAWVPENCQIQCIALDRPQSLRLTCPYRLTDVCNRGNEGLQYRESGDAIPWVGMTRVHPLVFALSSNIAQ